VGQIGLGFAGAGWLGGALLDEIRHFPSLSIAGVQDIDGQLAAEVAARYGCTWHGTDFDELTAVPEVSAVVICTPNAFHATQAQAALRAGKDVLVQKPLALSVGDARQTVHLAEQVGKVLFVDYTYRYLPTTDVLRQALPLIGTCRLAAGAFHNIYGPRKAWFFERRLSGGGALTDLGVHLLDLAIDLLCPAAVQLGYAALSFQHGYQVEDASRLEVRLDGTPLSLEVSWNADRPSSEVYLELAGDDGILRWENVDGSFFHFRTLRDGVCLIDRETSLRIDTLQAFCQALVRRSAPPVDIRTYEILSDAYARSENRTD
jgi:predicted dehydrogenase